MTALTEYTYRYGGKLYNVDTPDADVDYRYNGAGQRVSLYQADGYKQTDYYWNGMSVFGRMNYEGGRRNGPCLRACRKIARCGK